MPINVNHAPLPFVVIGVAAALLGCSDSPTHPAGCFGDVQVTTNTRALGSATPVFSWTPRCGVTDLTVATVPRGPGDVSEIMWAFTVPENAAMAPPIVYGKLPSGGFVESPAQPLVAGTAYSISVRSTAGGDAVSGGGSSTFVP